MNQLREGLNAGEAVFSQLKGIAHRWATKKKEPRRRFARFETSDCVLVDLTGQFLALGEVLNVSLGGLAFRFVDEGKSIPSSGKLRMFVSTLGLVISEVPFEIIWNQKTVYPLGSGNISTTHAGLRFTALPADRHRALRCFIENHTTADLEG